MLMEKLRKDLLVARKARDQVTTSLLTALVGESAMVGKNAGNRDSTDEEVTATIRKFVKNAEETLTRVKDVYPKKRIQEEINILKNYLPTQMDDDQLRAVISDIVLATAGANMGSIMKLLKEGYNGQYDGKRANELIKEILA